MYAPMPKPRPKKPEVERAVPARSATRQALPHAPVARAQAQFLADFLNSYELAVELAGIHKETAALFAAIVARRLAPSDESFQAILEKAQNRD